MKRLSLVTGILNKFHNMKSGLLFPNLAVAKTVSFINIYFPSNNSEILIYCSKKEIWKKCIQKKLNNIIEI